MIDRKTGSMTVKTYVIGLDEVSYNWIIFTAS